MKRYVLPSLKVFFLGTILLGMVYPVSIWLFAHLFFPHSAEGSPVTVDGETVGLRHIGQRFTRAGYFWSRPSWGYRAGNRLVSGGSNLSWSSQLLRANVLAKSKRWNVGSIPEDMVMASASGCDPDISIKAAYAQVPRVARARKISQERLYILIAECEEVRIGELFPKRINVLNLNCTLDNLPNK